MVVFFGLFFLDFFTTLLTKTQYEINPFIRYLLQLDPIYFLWFKILLAVFILIGFIIVTYFKVKERAFNIVMIAAIILFVFAALNNIWVYFHIS